MKLAVYSCRPDERPLFEKYAAQYQIELAISTESPSLENAFLVRGCQAVCVITTPVPADLIDVWHTYGVQVISTRTIGYEHVDYQHAAHLGIVVSNVSYTPHTVAEYTVMTILMTIRRMKTILTRYIGQDYSLTDIRGRELRHMTVGIVGTGRIGETVIENLSGFGCRILANNLFERDSVKKYASYVDLDTIWKECDLISFHVPAAKDTYHMVNADTIRRMKDGVILINMARGSIIDTPALIHALETRKVAAAALDVVENESHIYYRDFKYTPVGHHEMAILNSMPNVLLTPHTAFFTDEAVSNMIEYSIRSCLATVQGEPNTFQVN